MISYVLVACVDTLSFNRKVKDLTDQGYRPYGQPFVRTAFEAGRCTYNPTFTQAFVKDVDPDERD